MIQEKLNEIKDSMNEIEIQAQAMEVISQKIIAALSSFLGEDNEGKEHGSYSNL